jgi:MraZ protein
MFRGRHIHSIDDKGRLSVPSTFRETISSDGNVIFITSFDDCLVAYSRSAWLSLESAIALLPQFDENVLRFTRMFVASSHECGVDKAGRVLIAPELRTAANLHGPTVVQGMLNRFEIWDRSRFCL